jgi:glyoxylase-like metal-dependent hydrolase (beta-lactamase superfamily II)
MSIQPVDAAHWYETLRMSDDVTLIHEPWIKPFFRCNMWHVRGRDRDLLLVCVASHTHFDHIGCHHEFGRRCVHRAEAAILADPRAEWTLADRYATDEMFVRPPFGWSAGDYHVQAAPAGRELSHGDTIDLGDRSFDVIHTPGHSPGGIGLFERATGVFLSGDILYDGPLIDDAYHSDRETYVSTLETLRSLPVAIVHGGHFPSFGPTRFQQLIEEYLAGRRSPGCHLNAASPGAD